MSIFFASFSPTLVKKEVSALEHMWANYHLWAMELTADKFCAEYFFKDGLPTNLCQ